jgi:methyl-accepting chemotaxis protein
MAVFNAISTIKSRLILGVGILILTVVVSAIGGLLSIFSLDKQIYTITNEASPTIEESDDLIAALWESAKIANEILASEDIAEVNALSAELNQLSDVFEHSYNSLMQIIDDPKYRNLIESALTQHDEFKRNAQDMVAAHISELEEEEKAKGLLVEFDKQGDDLIIMLDEFALENEEEMQKANDEGNNIVARYGSAIEIATILNELFERDYPVVEAALKLQRLISELKDTSGEYLAEEIPENLPSIQTDFDTIVKNTIPFFKVLLDLAETEEDLQDVKDLEVAFQNWVHLANNDEMLFDSYRDQLDMEYKANLYTEKLEINVDSADSVLEQVAAESDRFMKSSHDKAQTQVNKATTIQIALMIFAVICGAIIILVFIQLLIKPLKELSKRLQNIANGEGDLTQRADDTANNEIGELAGNFNLFIAKMQGMIQRIASVTNSMTQTVTKMDSATTTVSKSVAQQSSETDSTATAIEEMTASAEEINKNIQDVSDSTSSASHLGKQAKKVVDESIRSIQLLAENIRSNAMDIENLNGEAESIGSVLTVIRSIADQTNLLALNAAIEAARAGDQGRGFAVVADEVRTLAARTQKSTQEIQEMIEKLQNGSLKAVKSMQQSQENSEKTVEQSIETGDLLDSISDSVTQVDEKVAMISSAVEQQSIVSNDINKSINNIVSSAQLVETATNESTEYASSLKNLEKELSELVRQFKV